MPKLPESMPEPAIPLTIDCVLLAKYLQDLGIERPILGQIAETEELETAIPIAKEALRLRGIEPNGALGIFFRQLETQNPL